jgi:hypothetical protein
MGLHQTAHYLKSKGRGKDTMLVHMTPGEVKGLQALAMSAGGSLTINPETGLPEAGFLERMLPMVIGAGLAATGVGAPMAALMVGGGYGLATGSMEKGLMAGLGAYGGAGLAGSLGSLGAEAGATAAQQTATNLGTEAVSNTAAQALPAGYDVAGAGFTPTEMLSGSVNPTQFADVQANAAQNLITPQNFPGLTPTQIQSTQSAMPDLIRGGAAPENIMGSLGRASAAQSATTGGNILAGVKEVGTSLPAAGQFVSSNLGTIGATALPFLMEDQQGQQDPSQLGYVDDEYDKRLKGYRLGSNFRASEAVRPSPYYQAQYPTYAAEGGVMKLADGGMAPMGNYGYPMNKNPDTMPNLEVAYGMAEGGIARYRNKGQVNVLQDYIDRQGQQQMRTLPESVGVPRTGIFRDTDVDTARKDALTATMIRLGKIGKGAGIKPTALPKTSIKGLGDISGATREMEEAASGGIMRYNLGGYSDGGRMLKGPGDGMSDSIPASIAGKQPARLADGEFVVPADVVSHLGNGSTDAGAKKLYGMMAKIRKARTGKKKQAPAVKAAKYMPA